MILAALGGVGDRSATSRRGQKEGIKDPWQSITNIRPRAREKIIISRGPAFSDRARMQGRGRGFAAVAVRPAEGGSKGEEEEEGVGASRVCRQPSPGTGRNLGFPGDPRA